MRRSGSRWGQGPAKAGGCGLCGRQGQAGRAGVRGLGWRQKAGSDAGQEHVRAWWEMPVQGWWGGGEGCPGRGWQEQERRCWSEASEPFLEIWGWQIQEGML